MPMERKTQPGWKALVSVLAPPLSLALALALADRSEASSPKRAGQVAVVKLEVDGSKRINVTDQRYVSLALDTAVVLGGEFWSKEGKASLAGDRAVPPLDLSSPVLLQRARALAPAYLRIGGTAADVVDYQMGDGAPGPLPKGDKLRLTRQRWKQIIDFADELTFPLMFTLNAGPAARDGKGAWNGANAAALIAAAAGSETVHAWELGNEVNAYPVMHGLTKGVSGQQLAADLRAARALLDGAGGPGSSGGKSARLAAPASAYWPVLGEANGLLEETLRRAGDALQIVTWHYYPQQSRRCPVAVRRAKPELLLDPAHLDEFLRWAGPVGKARDAFAPAAELWLGETGNAQCGGEPGVSDTFAGSLWWIDELGLAARTGHQVVVRQALVGSDYGLLAPDTLEPRPDYWATVMWKETMGRPVLGATVRGSPKVRAYAHCAAHVTPRAVGVAVVNLDREAPAEIQVPWPTEGATVLLVTAPSLDSRSIRVNGGDPAAMEPAPLNGPLRLPPLSYALAVFPAADANACPAID